MAFKQLKSLHGRQLGISSTGGLISAVGSTGQASTDFVVAAQMWGDGMFHSHSSSGATLYNEGVNFLAGSASATAATFAVPAPVKGVGMEVIIGSSASAITFETTLASIKFLSSAGAAASSALALTAATLLGGSLILRGQSASRWNVMGKTV